MRVRLTGTTRSLVMASSVVALSACDFRSPEVVVVNEMSERVLLRALSFQGCKWDDVLVFGASTTPDRCLPGDDKVHFQRLDIDTYCSEELDDDAGLRPCGAASASEAPGGGASAPEAPGGGAGGSRSTTPLWFNYQTVSTEHAAYDQFHVFRITQDNVEQDFSVPGPYGH